MHSVFGRGTWEVRCHHLTGIKGLGGDISIPICLLEEVLLTSCCELPLVLAHRLDAKGPTTPPRPFLTQSRDKRVCTF